MTLPPPHSHRRLGLASTSLAGVLLMVLGLIWLLTNLHLLDARDLIHQGWPLVLILFGIGRFLQHRRDPGLLGTALVVGGLWAFAIEQQWIRTSFFAVYIPSLLVLLGGSVIWRSLNPPIPGPPMQEEPYARIFSMFSSNELRPSQPFAGAEVMAIMGGAKLDLTRTPPSPAPVVIHAYLLMGGVELLVPSDWEVTVNALTFMGGCADSRRPGGQLPTRRLIINGAIMMGGLEIKD